jgi:para-nitrobenzyl esterase
MLAPRLNSVHRKLWTIPAFLPGALVALFCLMNLRASLAQDTSGPKVTVTGGQIQGRSLPAPGGAIFKGIPYAAPPTGDLRWREPQPVKPWTGVLQTGEFRPGCGQSVPGGADGGKKLTEDCLYLNVWVPEWPENAKKPVMFWINGGELAGGSGSLKSGAESLARHGVILVSANYRGTLLGMMGHPELTAESPHHASANYGILDEIAALKWIHDNIAQFGGDPGNVTVFGQSGGSHLTSMLLASPLTKGLIHRAILHSGAPMQSIRPYLTRDQLEQIGVVTAQVLKAPSTDQIKYLRGLPASEVVAAMPAVRTRLLQTTGQAYDEGTDGYAIPRPPNEVWFAHQEAAIPLMIGSTAHDTTAAIADEDPLNANASPEEVATWEKRLLELFYGKYPDLLQQALKSYGLSGGGPGEVSDYPPYGPPALQLGVDLNHRCSSALSAALHSTIAPTWQFEFTRTTPGHLPSHGSELRYIFGYDDLEDASSRKYSDIMQQYWTNFAKTGDPNGPGLPQWPKYSAATKPSLEFATDGPLQRTANRAAVCAPYIEKYTRNPKLLSNGDNLRVRGTGGAR